MGQSMAHEDLRLAGSVLALRRFSLPQLCKVANVKRNTVGSWFNRHKELFEEIDAPAMDGDLRKGRGRPQKTWRLREGCEANLRSILEGLYRDSVHAVDAPPHILNRVEAQLAAWEASRRFGSSTTVQEQVALRSLVRIAWENLAQHHRTSGEADASQMKWLAEMECAAGLGELPVTDRLTEVAAWMAERMDRMVKRAVHDEFAGRVLRARAEVRRLADRVKLTAAALAAPVWCDEGLIACPEAALRRCVVAADVVPVTARLEELDVAIDHRPALGYCIDEREAQAVVLGLATRPGANGSNEVRGWLAALHLSNDWLPEMAPAVLQGLAEARGIDLKLLVGYLKEPLQISLAKQKEGERLGALRRKAFDYGSRVLGAPFAGMPWLQGSMMERGATSADVIADELPDVRGFFAYRPRSVPEAVPLGASIREVSQ